MITSTLRTFVCAAGLTFATAAAAQQPAAPPQPGTAAPAKVEPPPAAPYSYEPQGRRDPFVSLVKRGEGQESGSNRAKGPAGLLIGEVTVKGIVRDRSGFIAMVQGPDQRTFNVRSGDKLMDGTVKAITADTVVFSQDVTDPLSLVKQKEVRKTVRSADGGRG
jgi:Tfp pilus assembly protein PilP